MHSKCRSGERAHFGCKCGPKHENSITRKCITLLCARIKHKHTLSHCTDRKKCIRSNGNACGPNDDDEHKFRGAFCKCRTVVAGILSLQTNQIHHGCHIRVLNFWLKSSSPYYVVGQPYRHAGALNMANFIVFCFFTGAQINKHYRNEKKHLRSTKLNVVTAPWLFIQRPHNPNCIQTMRGLMGALKWLLIEQALGPPTTKTERN